MRAVRKFVVAGLCVGLLVYAVILLVGIQDKSVIRYVFKAEPIRSPAGSTGPAEKQVKWSDLVVQNDLGSSLRICCMVMTSPQNLEPRTKYIKMTWGKRCDETVYISSQTNLTFPTVGIKTSEGRKYLLPKCFGGLRFMGEHLLDKCDWFFRGDDDTYLIVENLRHFLKDYETNIPMYFGHHFKTIVKQGYSSGGSGFVMSKEAMRRFGNESYNVEKTWESSDVDDAAVGQVMQNIGAKIGKSVDSQGRSRFHCLTPQLHLSGQYPDWYYSYDANGAKSGIPNMSDHPISFHYVPGHHQLELEYFLYYASVYKGGDSEKSPGVQLKQQIEQEHIKSKPLENTAEQKQNQLQLNSSVSKA